MGTPSHVVPPHFYRLEKVLLSTDRSTHSFSADKDRKAAGHESVAAISTETDKERRCLLSKIFGLNDNRKKEIPKTNYSREVFILTAVCRIVIILHSFQKEGCEKGEL